MRGVKVWMVGMLTWVVAGCGGREETPEPAPEAETNAPMEEVQKETAEALEALRGASYEKKEEVLERMGLLMDQLGEQVDLLGERATHTGEVARQRALEEWQTAGTHFAALKAASSESWGEMSAAFSDSVRAFREAYQAALVEMETGATRTEPEGAAETGGEAAPAERAAEAS